MSWRDRAVSESSATPPKDGWRSRAVEAPHEEKPSGVINALLTKDLEDASPIDVPAQVARLGQVANAGNQELAGIVAEKTGEHEARRSAEAGDVVELPVPELLGGGSIQAGALPGVAAAGALATASEFLLPQNRLGAIALLAKPAMEIYQSLKDPVKAFAKPGILAKIGQARTKVLANDIQQAIDDPSVFEAPTVAEANAAYGKAVGPNLTLKKSLTQKLNKTILAAGDTHEEINTVGRIFNGTEMVTDATGKQVPAVLDPQTALDGVQGINKFLKNKANTATMDEQDIGTIINLKQGLLDWMENNGSPDIRKAASLVRKAHVKENLSQILPQNKYGGTDALRTMAAGATASGAAGLALAGHPLAAVPLAAEAITASPAFLGGTIRNMQALSNPKVIGRMGMAINASQNIEELSPEARAILGH